MTPNELGSGVRTVTSLAAHFEELKLAAQDLAARVSPESRGYFTTAEEEETRSILVSYWKARNALFELILSIRDDARQEDDEYLESFVVAFAGAIVLVDAARFLREIVDGRPTVRSKLNEPALQFGVPANVYESIQKSLLTARHGWHLYHALQYYEEHEAAIRRLQVRADLADVVRLIQRLKGRLDISLSRFANAKLRTRADQLVRRAASQLFGRALYGMQKMVGSMLADKYVRPSHRPGVPDAVEQQLLQLVSPGDVIVVRKEFALTNYFLPGYWPHAALYLGSLSRLDTPSQAALQPVANMDVTTRDEPCVLEAMRDGVRIRAMSSPLASDSIVVIRPQLSEADIRTGLQRCLKHAGKPYDFGFDFRRSDRLVCTEVVYRAFDGIGTVELPLTPRVGRPTLSGGDLIRMSINATSFDTVAVYAPTWEPDVVTGPAAVGLLRLGVGEDAETE